MQAIKDLDSLLSSVLHTWRPTIAVAAADDEYVMAALREATDAGLARAILVGDVDNMRRISLEKGISLEGFEFVSEHDRTKAVDAAIALVREGRAQILMKGLVETATVLRAALRRDTGIRESDVMSHVGVFELPNIDRLIYITDAAISPYPDVNAKKRIIENSLLVAKAFGNEHPVVACLCALEKVNPKMPPTLDAAALVEMNLRGELGGCTVAGPLALDNALFPDCAARKGITAPGAGHADILLMPQIETGNALYKSFALVGRSRNAAVVVGAMAPIVMTSRVDPEETKLKSIALAIRMAVIGGKAK